MFKTGINYVPETGLALLHRGEAVIPANQNAYDQRKTYSPSIYVTVQGDGNISEIELAVEQALKESVRQFDRSGNVSVPGMA